MKAAVMCRPNVRTKKKTQNEIRADRAQQALQYYRVAGLREQGVDDETLIADLLTDIRHLADRLDLNLCQIDGLAYLNYLAEAGLKLR